MGNTNNSCSSFCCTRCYVESFVSVQSPERKSKNKNDNIKNNQINFLLNNQQTPSNFNSSSQKISSEFISNISPKKLEKFPLITNLKVLEVLAKRGVFDYSLEINKPELTHSTSLITSKQKSVEKKDFSPPLILENNSVYEGQWLNNLRHGAGRQLWENGALYEGFWENDKASIKGRLIHAYGDVYEGEWENNKANGFGSYLHFDGTCYEGEWLDDNMHGFGKETWVNGSSFEGIYQKGLKNGPGIFIWADKYILNSIIFQ